MNSYYEKNLLTQQVTCIDDEIPFDLPQGWEWERWGNISHSIQYGFNAPAKSSGDIRMVRISDIHDDKVNWSNVPFCDIKASEIETYLLSPNDILFARTGGTVGKSFIVKDVPEPAVYAGYLIRTRYSSLLCPDYLKHFMGSQLYWDQLRNGTIATAQPNCNGKTLGKMLLPIPPANEQRRIVDKLTELEPLLAKYGLHEHQLTVLNESINELLKKSILQDAIQGKLVPQIDSEGTADSLLEEIVAEKKRLVAEGKLKRSALPSSTIFRGDDNKYYEKSGNEVICIDEEIPFEIPESWCWCRIATISDSYIGLTYKPHEVSDNGTLVLRSSNIQDGELSLLDCVRVNTPISEKLYVASNDILICARNGSKKLVGKSCLIPALSEPMTFGAFMAICKTRFYKYVFLYLQSPLFFQELSEVSGTTTINQLTQKNFNKFLIPLPPVKEQQRIVDKANTIIASIIGF